MEFGGGYGGLGQGLGNAYYLDSSSDDELDVEINEFLHRPRRERNVRPRPDHFAQWDEIDFYMRFRLMKPTVMELLGQIGMHLATPTDR